VACPRICGRRSGASSDAERHGADALLTTGRRDDVDVRIAADAAAAAEAAARFVATSLRGAVRRRGTASFAVSGGSTPAAMFDVLTTIELPWDRIIVLQVDERVAPDGDPDRNAEQLRNHLVERVGLRAARVRWMPVTGADLTRAARRYATEIDAVSPIDVVHLGIGDDGHTASWPPGDPVIDSPLSVDVSAEFNGRRRMTLTPGPVNAARRRLLLVAGASKAPMVRRYLVGDPTIPMSRVRRTGTVLVADAAAASLVGRR
jgi:6-phosphogluconolactonase